MYTNAHTPPSLKRGGKRKKDQDEGGGKKPEQKKIVLQVKDLSEIYDLKIAAEAAGLPASRIMDAGNRDTAWHCHITRYMTWQVR